MQNRILYHSVSAVTLKQCIHLDLWLYICTVSDAMQLNALSRLQ